MASEGASEKKRAASTTRRTLHYYWQVTRRHFGLFSLLMVSTFLFVALLSYGNPYVMSLIVDKVSAGSVSSDEVFSAFGPFIIALIAINVFGQAASKLQDFAMYKLQIAASVRFGHDELRCAVQPVHELSFQPLRRHARQPDDEVHERVSTLLETVTFPFLPVVCSVVFTCAILAPRVPVYVAILMVLLAVYAGISYYMYKRILHLNEKAAGAQNHLSGELSDSVANILAVKTYGREDYERSLFDAANKDVVARDSKRMWASLTRGIITACITVVIMSVVYGVHRGRQRVVWHHAWHARNDVHLHLHGDQPVQLHQQRPAAFQPSVRRRVRHDGHA